MYNRKYFIMLSLILHPILNPYNFIILYFYNLDDCCLGVKKNTKYIFLS